MIHFENLQTRPIVKIQYCRSTEHTYHSFFIKTRSYENKNKRGPLDAVNFTVYWEHSTRK